MFKLNLFLIVMNQKWERGKYFLHIFGVLPVAPLSFSCEAVQGTITKYLQHSSQDFSSSCVFKQESNQKVFLFSAFLQLLPKKRRSNLPTIRKKSCWWIVSQYKGETDAQSGRFKCFFQWSRQTEVIARNFYSVIWL